jgi:hypothetical protein
MMHTVMLASKHINSNTIFTSKNGTDIEGAPIDSTISGGNIALLFSLPNCKILSNTPAFESFVKRLIAEKALPQGNSE